MDARAPAKRPAPGMTRDKVARPHLVDLERYPTPVCRTSPSRRRLTLSRHTRDRPKAEARVSMHPPACCRQMDARAPAKRPAPGMTIGESALQLQRRLKFDPFPLAQAARRL